MIFLPIPDPGVKKAPDPGSATLRRGDFTCSNDFYLSARIMGGGGGGVNTLCTWL
jgi:hypothetical protein